MVDRYHQNSASNICDGCMNGCSLNQPGCQRGMEKAKGSVQSFRSMEDAQQAFLQRQELLRKNIEVICESMSDLFAEWNENYISSDSAIRPDLIGMQIFDMPIYAVSNAFDPLYRELKKTDIVGPWHKLPTDWMKAAKRVISIFFPYSEKVRKNQRTEVEMTMPEWLHGRIEGHTALMTFTQKLSERIREEGYQTIIPQTEDTFGSTWSERHVAYISGLGTFGLSKGLITKRGIAGRFCSIVTDMLLPVTERECRSYDEWCTW